MHLPPQHSILFHSCDGTCSNPLQSLPPPRYPRYLEYLIGANNSIQAASVQSIFDSVLNDLTFNSNRTFHAVEVGFLMRYLESRPPAVTAQVQSFLANGQLTTSNGGWVMPDEASGLGSKCLTQCHLGTAYWLRFSGQAPSRVSGGK